MHLDILPHFDILPHEPAIALWIMSVSTMSFSFASFAHIHAFMHCLDASRPVHLLSILGVPPPTSASCGNMPRSHKAILAPIILRENPSTTNTPESLNCTPALAESLYNIRRHRFFSPSFPLSSTLNQSLDTKHLSTPESARWYEIF